MRILDKAILSHLLVAVPPAVLLGWMVHPGFYALSGFVGAGLTFAGATGYCGMAKLLALMPWNRPSSGTPPVSPQKA